MGAELTVRQKILVAATALGDESEAFSVEDLIVRTWNLFPESFSLRGYHAKHPDSNRVLAKLSGSDGLCGLGWLEHTDQRMYRVTRKGRLVSKQLQAVGTAAGAAPSLVAANEAGDEVEEVTQIKAAPARVAAKADEAPKARAPRKAAEAKVRSRVEKGDAPARAAVLLGQQDVVAIGVIAKGDALRKFLRGSPLTFGDACAFWGITPGRPMGAIQRIEATEDVLKRAVESFGTEGATDPRLPPLSTCYGLLNLHRLMTGRFAREIESLKVQLAAG